jgi:hypothetical protein
MGIYRPGFPEQCNSKIPGYFGQVVAPVPGAAEAPQYQNRNTFLDI